MVCGELLAKLGLVECEKKVLNFKYVMLQPGYLNILDIWFGVRYRHQVDLVSRLSFALTNRSKTFKLSMLLTLSMILQDKEPVFWTPGFKMEYPKMEIQG